MTDKSVTCRVLVGQAVHALGSSYGSGAVFTAAHERAERLVQLGVIEIIPDRVSTPEPEPAADHVEVRVPGGFRSLPRDEAKALVAAGQAQPFYPSVL
jgi:hypothetical protein